MILPTKHISSERALLTLGAEVLAILDRPRSVSYVWDVFRKRRDRGRVVGYDWFVLALDLLYLLGAVEYRNGTLVRSGS
jgi:hypothetical protein